MTVVIVTVIGELEGTRCCFFLDCLVFINFLHVCINIDGSCLELWFIR